MLTVFANQNINPVKEDEEIVEIISPGLATTLISESISYFSSHSLDTASNREVDNAYHTFPIIV